LKCCENAGILVTGKTQHFRVCPPVKMKHILSFLFVTALMSFVCGPLLFAEAESEVIGESNTAVSDVNDTQPDVKSVYVIPIHGPIASPTLYIVRRGVKEATANGVDTVLIDMNTPGGELGVTLEIMQILDRYEGETITFINNEAVSAGAFISVITDKIYMHPDGQIGAAEVVSGAGQDVPESMKRKLQSYINAKVRVYTKDFRYRGDVMRAMTDPDFELTVEGKEFSKKGELLSLTATEATQTYGEPPETLLASGIANDVDSVLEEVYGKGGYEIREFKVTWSEEFAQTMQKIMPILMGAGMLLLFIEFKTPNFGIIGGLGIGLIALAFLSNYIAGLAGYEAFLMFGLGILMFAIELFLLPGTVIFAFLGITMILASLVWSMADFWPNPDGFGFVVNWDTLLNAGTTVVFSIAGAFIALILLWKTYPIRWLESKLMTQTQSPSPSAVISGGAIRAGLGDQLPDQGSMGVVETALHPIGKVEINGKYYEATALLGGIDKGVRIRVVGYRSYSLLVEPVESEEVSS